MAGVDSQTIYFSWLVFLVLLFLVYNRESKQPDVKHARVSVTAAELIAMNTTAKTIVAAVTGKRIVVVDAELIVTAGSTAFTGGGAVSLYSGSSSVLHSTWAATVVTGATSPAAVIQAQLGSTSTTVSTALTLSNATAVFAAGNGTAVVSVRYYLI